MDHHTSPEDAGYVFTESGTKLAVYSHIIVGGYADKQTGISEMIRRTQTSYTGSLEVGNDLMSIEISDKPKVINRDSSQLNQ